MIIVKSAPPPPFNPILVLSPPCHLHFPTSLSTHCPSPQMSFSFNVSPSFILLLPPQFITFIHPSPKPSPPPPQNRPAKFPLSLSKPSLKTPPRHRPQKLSLKTPPQKTLKTPPSPSFPLPSPPAQILPLPLLLPPLGSTVLEPHLQTAASTSTLKNPEIFDFKFKKTLMDFWETEERRPQSALLLSWFSLPASPSEIRSKIRFKIISNKFIEMRIT